MIELRKIAEEIEEAVSDLARAKDADDEAVLLSRLERLADKLRAPRDAQPVEVLMSAKDRYRVHKNRDNQLAAFREEADALKWAESQARIDRMAHHSRAVWNVIDSKDDPDGDSPIAEYDCACLI